MKLRILGSHNLESADSLLESHVLDDVVALDAGSLTRALTFDEQSSIRAILLSHRHFDHVRDLLPLGLAMSDRGTPSIDIYGIADTLEFVSAKLLDGTLYPDLVNGSTTTSPILHLHEIEFEHVYDIAGMRVTPVSVPHAVPCSGFLIESGAARMFYTGDAGLGLGDSISKHDFDVLLTEVTFPNGKREAALKAGHMTPSFLSKSLRQFAQPQGHYPRVIVAHMDPPSEREIREELAQVAGDLGVSITVSHAGDVFDL